jgi:hypothetical protein
MKLFRLIEQQEALAAIASMETDLVPDIFWMSTTPLYVFFPPFFL